MPNQYYGELWPVPKALLGNEEKQITGHLRLHERVTRLLPTLPWFFYATKSPPSPFTRSQIGHKNKNKVHSNSIKIPFRQIAFF